MLKYGSEGAKHFFELHVLNSKHAKAHRSGDIHIHDLDFLTLTTTCCQIDIDKLFTGGFSTGHGFLREPNDIISYSALTCIAIQANQNDQHGGQSVPNFDYALAKGVAKTFFKLYKQNFSKAIELLVPENKNSNSAIEIIENAVKISGHKPSLKINQNYLAEEFKFVCQLTDEATAKKIQHFTYSKAVEEADNRTYQAMEAFVHNLNTMHSRAGAQVPFSNVNYGTDTSPEGRMVTKNLLLATLAGLGNSETPVFPIQIFKIKEGINYNKTDPNYDLFQLACKTSAKRLFPNFSFLDAKFNLPYYKPNDPNSEVAYMGCRTRVIGNVYDKTCETTFGRGNLSFTSINLPRLGILSNKNLDVFNKLLDEKINLVIKQLLARFEIQAQKKVRNFPFLMGQGIWIDSDKLGVDDEIREVIKHGTLSMGFIGLAECLKALTGFHHGENADIQKLGIQIIRHMRQKMDKASKKYNLNFTLLATPAEGLSGRFVRLDRESFGKIPEVTDRKYYTNSFHVPVYYKISAFEKIQLEAPYHEFTNAGHISYVELDGDPGNNLEAFENIIRCMKKAGIGYGSINHPVDRDPICGFTGIIGDSCPKCGRAESENSLKFERIRRITGYLVGTLDRFNNAKRAEEKDRVKHLKI
jgi:ribonucleoside-triphosphate reductase